MKPQTIRLVAIDLDGTMLRPDRTIAPAVHAAIARAARVATVLVATARPPRSMRNFVHDLKLEGTPHVVYNGAATWDCRTNLPRSHVPIERGTLTDLIAHARRVLPECIVNLECLDRWLTDRLDDRYTTETGRLFQPDMIAPLDTFGDTATTKLMIHAGPPALDALRAELERAFAGRALLIRTDPDLLQAVNPQAGKWPAVRAVAAEFGIAPGEILAIGDNENDVEMLREAGLGVAMASGTRAAIDAADWIAPSNLDDGVAIALDRFVNAG